MQAECEAVLWCEMALVQAFTMKLYMKALALCGLRLDEELDSVPAVALEILVCICFSSSDIPSKLVNTVRSDSKLLPRIASSSPL